MIKVDRIELRSFKYPDGVSSLKMEKHPKVTEHTIQWIFESEEELIYLIYLVKHLKTSYNKIHLEMPYIPNARLDRVGKDTSEVFTLKYFCEIINSLNFESVTVMHPHSNVSVALLDRVIVSDIPLSNIELLLYAINPSIIFYPDEGCKKQLANDIKFPSAFGIKNRDWGTGKIKDLSVLGEIPKTPFDVLIVDDICSYGGTIYNCAKKLKELGADKIYIYITHCENSILDGELIKSGLIEKIYTTPTIFTKKHKLIEFMPQQ